MGVAQAVTFLVIHQKHKKSLEEITNDLCPVLSVQQLYRISTMYWDDRYNTETVSHEVCTSPHALLPARYRLMPVLCNGHLLHRVFAGCHLPGTFLLQAL